MAIQVNIAEAKARLSELVRRAEAGEEVILARDGKPVAVIGKARAEEEPRKRVSGLWSHLGPLTDAQIAAVEEPLYTEEELDEMIEDWGIPRSTGNK